MYRVVAGIDAGTAGYKHIIIRPMPANGLDFAEAAFDSMYGRISSFWKKDGDAFQMVVEIPANTTAEVILPKAFGESITINGEKPTENSASIKIGSGLYNITQQGCKQLHLEP